MSKELPLLPHDPQYFLDHLRSLARLIQERVLAATRAAEYDDLARAVHTRGGDVIYALDVHAEEVLREYCRQWGEELPFLLIAEGIENGRQVFPGDARPTDVRFTLIVDPVDGTRGLMYGKRSAWFLAAVAAPPDGNFYPTLADIQIALGRATDTTRRRGRYAMGGAGWRCQWRDGHPLKWIGGEVRSPPKYSSHNRRRVRHNLQVLSRHDVRCR